MSQSSLVSILKDISKDKVKLIFIFSIFLSFLIVCAYLVSDFYSGGSPWKQGDWLINNHSEFVRRGVLGSIFLWISDFASINPLYIVIGVQLSIVSIIYYCFLRAGLYFRCNEFALFLIMSPLFLFFWSNDPWGSMRKEILVYLSFVPFVLLSLKSKVILVRYVFLSQCLYLVAVFGHEANVFFVPFFAAFIYIFTGCINLRFFQIFFPYMISSIMGFFYFYFNTSVDDFMDVCRPILRRGVEDHICEGAIRWLAMGSSDAFSTATKIIENDNLFRFFLSYFLLFVFYIYIFNKFLGFLKSTFIFLFSIFPFIPLYFVGEDWGRWINFHIFSLTTLSILYFIVKDLRLDINKYERGTMFFFCVSWGASHVGGYFGLEYGFVDRLVLIGSRFIMLFS